MVPWPWLLVLIPVDARSWNDGKEEVAPAPAERHFPLSRPAHRRGWPGPE